MYNYFNKYAIEGQIKNSIRDIIFCTILSAVLILILCLCYVTESS